MSRYITREAERDDFNKGHLELLCQLSESSIEVSINDYHEQLCRMSLRNNSKCFVIEHDKRIIASGTIMIEYKLSHGLCLVGHIEDVVVDEEYRGMGVGSIMLNRLIEHAVDSGCKKIVLNCGRHNEMFYLGFGFNKVDFGMVMKIDN